MVKIQRLIPDLQCPHWVACRRAHFFAIGWASRRLRNPDAVFRQPDQGDPALDPRRLPGCLRRNDVAGWQADLANFSASRAGNGCFRNTKAETYRWAVAPSLVILAKRRDTKYSFRSCARIQVLSGPRRQWGRTDGRGPARHIGRKPNIHVRRAHSPAPVSSATA